MLIKSTHRPGRNAQCNEWQWILFALELQQLFVFNTISVGVDWSENNLSHKFCVNWVHIRLKMYEFWESIVVVHHLMEAAAPFIISRFIKVLMTIWNGCISASRTRQWPLETTKFICDKTTLTPHQSCSISDASDRYCITLQYYIVMYCNNVSAVDITNYLHTCLWPQTRNPREIVKLRVRVKCQCP